MGHVDVTLFKVLWISLKHTRIVYFVVVFFCLCYYVSRTKFENISRSYMAEKLSIRRKHYWINQSWEHIIFNILLCFFFLFIMFVVVWFAILLASSESIFMKCSKKIVFGYTIFEAHWRILTLALELSQFIHFWGTSLFDDFFFITRKFEQDRVLF